MTSWKTSLLVGGVAAATFFAGRATTELAAQEPQQQAAAEEMMKAQEAAGRVGKFHKLLDRFTGTWNAEVKMFMDPSADPVVMPGKMTNEWVMDGRFLKQKFEGQMMGQKFAGVGYWGYNNVSKEYEGVWLDSMSTAISVSRGKPSASDKSFEMVSQESDPRTGEKVKVKSMIEVQDEDHHTYSRYHMTPGGPVKGLEIHYTRS